MNRFGLGHPLRAGVGFWLLCLLAARIEAAPFQVKRQTLEYRAGKNCELKVFIPVIKTPGPDSPKVSESKASELSQNLKKEMGVDDILLSYLMQTADPSVCDGSSNSRVYYEYDFNPSSLEEPVSSWKFKSYSSTGDQRKMWMSHSVLLNQTSGKIYRLSEVLKNNSLEKIKSLIKKSLVNSGKFKKNNYVAWDQTVTQLDDLIFDLTRKGVSFELSSPQQMTAPTQTVATISWQDLTPLVMNTGPCLVPGAGGLSCPE